MKKTFKILQYCLFLGIAFIMVWWSLKGVDISYIIQIISNANIRVIVIVTVIVMFSHWIRALRWNLLINTLGYKPSTLNALFCVLIGYFANLFIPRLGEVLRCTLIAKHEKMPADKIIGTVLLERIIDMCCLLTICLLVFLLQIDLLGSFFTQQLLPKLKTIDTTFYCIAGIAFIGFVFIAVYISRKNKKFEGVFIKVKQFLIGIGNGMKSILQLQQKTKFLFYTILIWSCYLFSFWYGFRALEQTELMNLNAALTCLVTGSIGMIATQGGIGAYPLLIGQTLTWYGIAKIYGISMGWLNWVTQFIICIITGAISWVAMPLYNSKLNIPKKL